MSRLPWKPIKLPFGQLDQRLDEQFERFLLGPWEQSPLSEWQPQIDVLETDVEYVIEADLPGVIPEHLTVEAKSDGVTICGHRSQSNVAATHHGIWTERHQGQFCRHFRLTGLAAPRPGSCVFQARFCSSLQRTGTFVVAEPLPFGPRNCDQLASSALASDVTAMKYRTRVMAFFCMYFRSKAG